MNAQVLMLMNRIERFFGTDWRNISLDFGKENPIKYEKRRSRPKEIEREREVKKKKSKEYSLTQILRNKQHYNKLTSMTKHK